VEQEVSNSDPLYIGNEMAAYDRKDRAYYDKFTDEQRKSFSTYLMLKYGANVSGSADMQAYYLMAANERVNKHFFDINRHTKLQWLTCTTVSPQMGNQFHYWLKAKKNEGDNKSQKFLAKLYPTMKSDEIELMAKINDKRDIADMARNLGFDDKSIKAEL
jgi:hypothetical protein